MNRNGPASGFTLLEVMIALAIFGLAAVVLGGAYINVLNAYARVGEASRQHEDVRFARHALLLETDLEEAEEGGEFETVDGRQVQWRARIEPTDVADLFDVVFTCELGRTLDDEPEVVEQQFRLLRPGWSEATERETLRQEARDRILKFQRTLPGGMTP